MPIRANNTNGFFRRIYSGQTENVCLIKREDDQRQGITRTTVLLGCRWDEISKAGQALKGSMASNHRRALHIPKEALRRAGVDYINVLDRFRDKEGRLWQPESPNMIVSKLFENQLVIYCQRCDDQFVLR